MVIDFGQSVYINICLLLIVFVSGVEVPGGDSDSLLIFSYEAVQKIFILDGNNNIMFLLPVLIILIKGLMQ